jgi:hypothetical protein
MVANPTGWDRLTRHLSVSGAETTPRVIAPGGTVPRGLETVLPRYSAPPTTRMAPSRRHRPPRMHQQTHRPSYLR